MFKGVFRGMLTKDDGKLFPSAAESLTVSSNLGSARPPCTDLISDVVSVGVVEFLKWSMSTMAIAYC